MLGSYPMSRLPNPRQPLAAVSMLARNDVRLFLVSATILFAELMLIRWIPANVRYVGFFSNFLLMASFLGIGIGILLGRRDRRLVMSPFPALLLVTFGLVMQAQLNVKLTTSDEIFFGLEANQSADVNFLVLPLLVVLVTALMASLALPLGPLLRSMPPLRAYTIDIAGSMVGIVAFAALAALNAGPVAWFSLIAIAILLQALGRGVTPWSALGGGALAIIVAIVAIQAVGGRDIWSPYYRISTYDASFDAVSARPGSPDLPKYIYVDGIPHQEMLAVGDAIKSELHTQIYRWFPTKLLDDVLVIGAGSGTDVALALSHNAHAIDAVEIDPEIARIGRDYHPDEVYSSPKVTTHVNDGRAFLRNSGKKYDLVVFALTDSLTLVSSTANLRLESFLFTEEALVAARDHLKDNGVFVMYNFYREPWLIEKLNRMVADVHGHEPLVRLHGGNAAVIAAGPGVTALQAKGVPAGESDVVPDSGGPEPRAATDDWPFLYLRVPAIASYYLVALGFLLAFAAATVFGAARVSGASIRRCSPHFFVLGIAFLLLETKSLVTFSLLFGTTWFVNALTFFAILGSVLLAIFVNARWRLANPAPLYVALVISVAVAWLLPPEVLLLDPPALRYLLAGVSAFAPVFFANLVFTHSFRDTASADMAFASNLIGAMVGGVLEYLALLTGFRALLLIVAALYVLAFVLSRRWRLLADVDLVAEPAPA